VPITTFFKPAIVPAPPPWPPSAALALSAPSSFPTLSNSLASVTIAAAAASLSFPYPAPSPPARELSAAHQAEVDAVVQDMRLLEMSNMSPFFPPSAAAPFPSSSAVPVVPATTIPFASPPPFEEHDQVAWSEQTFEYAQAFCDYVEGSLPQMYAQQPVSTAGNWRAAKTIFTEEFPFPCPLQLQYHPTLRKFARIPAAFELDRAVLVIDDPMIFYSDFMPEKGLVWSVTGIVLASEWRPRPLTTRRRRFIE